MVEPAPQYPDALGLELAYALFANGGRGEAMTLLRQAEAQASGQPRLMGQIAQLYSQMGAHDDALAMQRQLDRLLPDHADVLIGLAASETAMGLIDAAEAHLDRALTLDPGLLDGWYNRSTLRRQTGQRNHIDALRARLASLSVPRTRARAVPLYFALAKELEDVGAYAESFSFLQQGADCRRAALSYRVETDIEAMALIEKAFPGGFDPSPAAARPDAGPIFIVGLPRTGSTLIERILSAHHRIESLGELPEFAMAVTRALPAAGTKEERIKAAAALDFAALGQSYRLALSGYRTRASDYVDKMPSNFLYVGLICQALPEARILHVRRRPLDTLYAIYKTLFRMGYPYSYDFDDLARYYAAYRRLMAHWRRTCSDRLIEVDYEDLVADPENRIRALIAALHLDWDEGCLEFHRSQAPVATASAAQVREPIYRRSVGLWRHYETELAPLVTALKAQGIDPFSEVPA